MDNYTKGGNELEEVSREMIPIKGLSGSCIWMRVKAGSKVKNLSTVAMRALRDNGEVIFSGHGQALNKVIACAEIVKRNAVIEPEEKIFQYNKVNYLKEIEHWDPKSEDLDPLKVIREIPQMFIALTKSRLENEKAQNEDVRQFLCLDDSELKDAKKPHTMRKKANENKSRAEKFNQQQKLQSKAKGKKPMKKQKGGQQSAANDGKKSPEM